MLPTNCRRICLGLSSRGIRKRRCTDDRARHAAWQEDIARGTEAPHKQDSGVQQSDTYNRSNKNKKTARRHHSQSSSRSADTSAAAASSTATCAATRVASTAAACRAACTTASSSSSLWAGGSRRSSTPPFCGCGEECALGGCASKLPEPQRRPKRHNICSSNCMPVCLRQANPKPPGTGAAGCCGATAAAERPFALQQT